MLYLLLNSQSSLPLADSNSVRPLSSYLKSSYFEPVDDLGVSMRLKYGFLLKVHPTSLRY